MEARATCLLSAGPDALASGSLSDAHLRAGARAGFGALLWHADDPLMAGSRALPETLGERCAAAGLILITDVELARWPVDHELVLARPELFALRRAPDADTPIDPRTPFASNGIALARFAADGAEALVPALVARLRDLIGSGVGGVRVRDADRIAPDFLRNVFTQLRRTDPDIVIGVDAGAGCLPGGTEPDFVSWSLASPDFRSPQAIEQLSVVRRTAPVFVEVARPTGLAFANQGLLAAAAVADGLIVPVEIARNQPEAVARAVRWHGHAAPFTGELRRLTGSGSIVAALLRSSDADIRSAESALLLLVNTSASPQPVPDLATLLPTAGLALETFTRFDEGELPLSILSPGEARLLAARRATPITLPVPTAGATHAAEMPRLVIEDITPAVAGGPYAVKRVVGERLAVDAKIFADGHEQLAAEILWRAADEADWTAARMTQMPNDLWRGGFPLARLGRHEFLVEAWLHRFAGFQRDFRKKLDAGVAQPIDHAEGVGLVERARDRATGALKAALAAMTARLTAEGADTATLLLAPELTDLMERADDRPHRLRSPVQTVDAERLQARFSSWYELFPRSQTDDPHRHGTFADVIERLPAIRDMGFDTLYFPPIHPIGKANRKGPNNTLDPGPDDPGSPYAIGSPDGGHDAIHPELGSFDDFARLIEAARAHGLEIALDFAIQCSPDHPWLKEHPGWFDWRPDGTIKYAENPPKKYQDIVNVDFYKPDAIPGLWRALRDVVLFWADKGVKTFRVDNPHTKPLPFWEWMIGEVRARYPDAIFLAEAFTRPAMMYRLAKIGFSQSYTYFTWRDRKDELVDYLTELTTTAPREFYRPHFFVNTPDINPLFLQTSGRAGFRIRAVLAATLSGLFGVYSGFELCEAAPVPGKEEYLDSEKYELRPRDWQAPGNIIADITLLNRLRRAHPALQTHLNTRFYIARNDNVIWFGKMSPDGSDMIAVMVSLDPHNPQEAQFEVPLWEFGLPDDGSVAVEDLGGGYRFRWSGKTQSIRLNPDLPYRIWRLSPGETA